MINAKIELALARVFFLFSSANAIISEFGQALEPWFLEIRERGEEIEEVGQRGRRNDCVGKPGGHLIHHRAKNKLRPEKDFPRGEKRSADREQTGVGPSRGSSKGWRIPFASSILEKGKMFALLRGRDVSTDALPPKFHSEQTVYRSFLSLSLSLSCFPSPLNREVDGIRSRISLAYPPPVFEMATNRNRACRESLNAGNARRKRRWLSDDGNNSFGRRESSFGEYGVALENVLYVFSSLSTISLSE